jgi:hypothetical protein
MASACKVLFSSARRRLMGHHTVDDSWYDNFYTLEVYLLENFPDV